MLVYTWLEMSGKYENNNLGIVIKMENTESTIYEASCKLRTQYRWELNALTASAITQTL